MLFSGFSSAELLVFINHLCAYPKTVPFSEVIAQLIQNISIDRAANWNIPGQIVLEFSVPSGQRNSSTLEKINLET